MAVLTAYLIRSRSRQGVFEDPIQAIDSERGADEVDLRDDLPFQARLFIPPADASMPDWQNLLEQGSAGPLNLQPGASNGAALFVRVALPQGDRWIAFTFGFGRYLLKREWLERRFGLRVALNLAYPRGEVVGQQLPPRLKTIDAKTIEDVTYDTTRRASRSVPLENFGLNIRRDLMSGVEAYPADRGSWGKVVRGATPFRHGKTLAFRELGERARRLVEVWAADDFRDRFAFIEHIRPVDDDRTESLELRVTELLQAQDHGGFDLVPPEDFGSESVAGFRLPSERGTSYDPELTLQDYLKSLKGAEPDVIRMMRDTIRAVDAAGKPLGRASAFEFLTGQLALDGATYVLIEGVFYEVHDDYLGELAADIAAIPSYAGPLPAWRLGESETSYNRRAAASRDLLLMDAQLVRPAGRSSGVEVCDMLSRTGALLHVKKKSRSSTLSHLFSQGHVSAELLIRQPDFRAQLIQVVGQIESDRQRLQSSFRPGFSALFNASGVVASQHEVVFVIIGDWRSNPTPGALPFFSKVNLRQHAEDLRAMDFPVSCACISNQAKATHQTVTAFRPQMDTGAA